jgi:CBS domain-containing protein
MKLREIMTRDVSTVTPETSLRDLAMLLSERQISGVPVVDADGVVVGVISEADLLVKQLSRPLSRRLPIEWILGERHDPEELRRRAATTVGGAMSAPAVTIEIDQPIREAANLMVDRRVNRLPVLADGQLVGIVSRADLVGAYLTMDEDIADTVREKVLHRTMWLDPDTFDVSVNEGVVRIAGTVDRRTTAGIVERLIGITDGVVEVQSELRWRMDDTDFEPAGAEREPGAASIVARDRPPTYHG